MTTREGFSNRYGPWAIVTGASSGIGEAFAHAIAKRGVHPLLVARRDTELTRVAKDVQEGTGIECATLTVDLGDPSFIEAVEERTGDLDVGLVVSNAGMNPLGRFEERTAAELSQIIDVNCKAPLLLAHAFRPRLEARGRGGFLITGSVEGFFGIPYSAAYSPTKGYALALGEALWGELAETDVDVLVLAPGATDTPIIHARNMRDLPGLQQPSEVAEFGLDALREGPVAIPGDGNQQMVAAFAGMPRTDAVVAMGKGMKAAMERSVSSEG